MLPSFTATKQDSRARRPVQINHRLLRSVSFLDVRWPGSLIKFAQRCWCRFWPHNEACVTFCSAGGNASGILNIAGTNVGYLSGHVLHALGQKGLNPEDRAVFSSFPRNNGETKEITCSVAQNFSHRAEQISYISRHLEE